MGKPLILNLFLFILFFLSVPLLHSQTGGIPTGSDTTCTTGVSLYQKIYGGSKDDYVYPLAIASDSGQVVAGKTNSIGAGGYDGLIMKMNKRGNVVWSKAFGGGNDDEFTDIQRTSDNGYIACGTTKSYGNAAGEMWLVKVDGSGNTQWAKKYGDGSVEGDLGRTVTQLSDGGYALCGIYKWAGGGGGIAQSFVVRTDGQGNVIWSKQYSVIGVSDDAVGILEDSSSLLVAGNYNGGVSFMDAYVMKLDKTNGTVQWTKRYDAENRSTWFGRIVKTNTGYQVGGIITDNFGGQNQQVAVWNLSTDGTVQNVRKVVIPGILDISGAWLALADGGFIVADGENNNGSDVLLSKVSAAGNIVWSKKYQRAGRQQIYSIRGSNEGGYVLAGNNNNAGTTADSSNVYVMKVDSAGAAGTCSGINTTDVTIVTPSFVTANLTVPQSNVTINNPVITASSANFIIVPNTICNYCKMPVIAPPVDTTCTTGVSLYQKIYGGSKDDYVYPLAIASDSGQVVAGKTNSIGAGGYDGLIMKMNKRGNVVWSKVFGGSNDDEFTSLQRTSDNGYIACGTTKSYGNTAGEIWLVKVDGSGNTQWTKKYGDGSVEGELGRNVVQLSDGGYALCGIYKWAGGGGGIAQSFVVRTDGQGNVIWSKQYSVSAASDDASDILEDSSSLVVVGYYNGGISFMDAYIMKLDKTNGAVQWIKRFDAENRSTWFGRIAKTNTGYQVAASITDNFGSLNDQLSIWNITTDGTLQNVRKVVIPGIQENSVGWLALADGGFVVADGENNNGSDVLLSKVSAAGNIVWSKKFPRAGRQQIYSIRTSNEGGYVLAGNNNNAGTTADSSNVYIMKVDSTGSAGTCSGINTTDVTIVTPSFVTSTLTAPVSDVTINNPVITVNPVNFDPIVNTLCFYCYLKPTGTQRTAIGYGKDHVLKVYPNPTSSDPINISIDAKYDDEATLSVVDMYGNILYTLSPRQIRVGQNLIKLNITGRLRTYSNYFIVVKYRNYNDAIKIFVVQ